MASSDYKKIDREIKGYIEVRYDVQEFSGNEKIFYIDSNGNNQELIKMEYSEEFSSLSDTNRIKHNYAVLHENYTLLDGTFYVFNKFSNNCGYISQKTPQEIHEENYLNEVENSGKIKFVFALAGVGSGLTLYTKNNCIKNATLVASFLTDSGEEKTETITILDNTKDILFIEFSKGEYSGGIVNLIVDEWQYPNKVINILAYDNGLTHIYQGNELIEFEITEQVDKLVEETPSNELVLTVGDYSNSYDPLNPKGIAKYLTEGSEFIPYIGIIDENGAIQFTKMGTFYFNSIDYQDKQVTIKCYNLMDKLNKVLITNNGTLINENRLVQVGGLNSYLTKYLNGNYGYNFFIDINNKITLFLSSLRRVSLTNFLQNASMIDGIFYVDRENVVTIKEIDKTVVEKISRQELLEDLKYTDEKKMTSFNLQREVFTLAATSETNDTDNFSTTVVMEDDSQIICITADDPSVLSWLQNYMVTVTGASDFDIIMAGTKNDFNYMLFLKVIAEKGDTVTISAKYPYKKDCSVSVEEEKIGTGESILTINNPFYYTTHYLKQDRFTKFFDKAYSYSCCLNYNGNPHIKAGDYIEAESNYGYIKLFVTKHTLKFNGGLSGSIEGVE